MNGKRGGVNELTPDSRLSTLFHCLSIELDVFGNEILHEQALADNIFFSHTNVNIGTLSEKFGRACGIIENQKRHNDLGGHIVKAARKQIVDFLTAISFT